MDRGLFGTFDYDRDYLQPPEPMEERDPADWVFSAGQWIYVGDCQPMNREHYEDNIHWRKRQLNTCYELGTIINEQQDKIVSLMNENNRLKRENWNLKHNRGRRK